MKRLLVFLAVVAMLFGGHYLNASAALQTSASTSPAAEEEYELNNATPGTAKSFLGTRTRGLFQTGSTIRSACASPYSACNSGATEVTTASYVVTTGTVAGESIALADGHQNHFITFVLETDGGADFYVSPVTKTGFTNVQLSDANDSVTLRFINSTVGWEVAGNNGATVN